MQPFDLHPEFYSQPIWLTQEEKENPMAVIKQFFEDVKLIEVRGYLNNLLEVALTTPNNIYDDSRERDAVLCFIKQLEKMVEAVPLIT
ncbi:hypothetical protein [Asinibacterium sp. OR53]|uniref:hypothetical protein n=1 Tax=Asinibacterium sp. OR53 TaxID=925409 RepID=UPI00055D819A|nr:hypothetical protein [Asinibacterium sp. OR53]